MADANDGGNAAFSQDDFVQGLREALQDEDFEERVEEFMAREASVVASGAFASSEEGDDGTGFSFEVHDLFKQYLTVVEGHLARFMADRSMTETEFRDKLSQAQSSGGGLLVRLMIASWEFDAFVELCKEFVEAAREKGGGVQGEGKGGEGKSSGSGDTRWCGK